MDIPRARVTAVSLGAWRVAAAPRRRPGYSADRGRAGLECRQNFRRMFRNTPAPRCAQRTCALTLGRRPRFHVAAPDSPEAGKRSYREIHAICLALEEERIAEGIAAVARKVVR